MFTQSAEVGSRVARVTLVALCVGYAFAPLLTLEVRRAGTLPFTVMVLGVVAYCVAFVALIWPAVRGAVPRGRRLINLLVTIYLATGMCLRFGSAWEPLFALSAGAAALVLPRYRAVALVGVLLVVEALTAAVLGVGVWAILRLLGAAILVVALVYVLGSLSRLGLQLDRSRVELARLAVLEERLRLARDLHDMLGHTLSIVALKSEVASRLVHAAPDRASAEMRSVAAVAREAIGDVRELVRGYRALSLEVEIDGVAGVLDAAGVHCTVEVTVTDLPASVSEALAWVVREGGTNVLRHSQASLCVIRLGIEPDAAMLELINDGIAPNASISRGNGLNGLAERLGRVGGVLRHESSGERFRLSATVPVSQSDGDLG